jgi:hypothetical protein
MRLSFDNRLPPRTLALLSIEYLRYYLVRARLIEVGVQLTSPNHAPGS